MTNPATLLGILAILFWAATVAVARSIAESIGPVTAGACVYLVAAVFAVFFHIHRQRKLPRPRDFSHRFLLGCGLLFVVYEAALFLALGFASNRSQSMEIGLINYLWPVLTVLFAVPLLDVRPSASLFAGVLLAIAGIVLVVGQGEALTITAFTRNIFNNPSAYFLGLLAAISWALYSDLTQRWGAGQGEGAVVLFLFATGLLLLVGRLFVHERADWSFATGTEILFMGIASACGYVFWDIAMRRGDFAVVSTASYFTPFFSTVIACFYWGIVPHERLWLGCSALIAGAVLSRLAMKERPIASAEKHEQGSPVPALTPRTSTDLNLTLTAPLSSAKNPKA